MLKKTFFFVIFFLLLIPYNTNAEDINHSNPLEHYSFSIPSDWQEIPKSTIDTAMKNAAAQVNTNPIEYSAGFQMQGTADFQYPYILIQEYKINTPSYSQIVKEIDGGALPENIDSITKKYSEFITEATAEKPYVDKEKDVILMTSYLTGPNNEKIRMTMAIFLGKYNSTRLYFYTTEDTYQDGISAFNKIMDSFKYEVAYAYDESEAKKNDSPNIFEGAVEKGITGAIIMGFVALIFSLSNRLKKKNKG